MRSRTRTAVVIAATAIGSAALGAAAVGGVAVAAPGTTPADATTEEDAREDDQTRSGSILVEESTLPEDDVGQAQALVELATVDLTAASAAALTAVGDGKVFAAELGEEDGYLVWEVEVVGADAQVHEVVVDAGDATVLATDVEEPEQEEPEAEEQAGAETQDDD